MEHTIIESHGPHSWEIKTDKGSYGVEFTARKIHHKPNRFNHHDPDEYEGSIDIIETYCKEWRREVKLDAVLQERIAQYITDCFDFEAIEGEDASEYRDFDRDLADEFLREFAA